MNAKTRRRKGSAAHFLTETKVRSLPVGIWTDAGCPTLYLRVLQSGARNWRQQMMVQGKLVSVGLGGYPFVKLAEARETALQNRRISRTGGDPRQQALLTHAVSAPASTPDAPPSPAFSDCFEAFVEVQKGSWKSVSTMEKKWRTTMRLYAASINDLPVARITSAHVRECLLPILGTKPIAAAETRSRIRQVMQWAIGMGYRTDNPAGEALAATLPKNRHETKNHNALPHTQIVEVMSQIHAADCRPAYRLSLEFIILTADRGAEVLGARWEEMDLEARVWTIPAERMKTRRAHRVPLSNRAVEVLREAEGIADGSGLVFPSQNGKVLGARPLRTLLQQKAGDVTIHGFRSSFRDWCAETGQRRELAEAALAHVVGGVEGAYFRSDLMEQRRELMDDWAAY